MIIQLLATNPEIIKSAFVSGCSVRQIPIVGNYHFIESVIQRLRANPEHTLAGPDECPRHGSARGI